MSSDVDICNTALALLGDDATVTSLSPPDGSAQASHCARFYPMARDALIEMHAWGFATTRAALVPLLANPSTDPYDITKSVWAYAYAAPNNIINYLEVLDPGMSDELSVGLQMANSVPSGINTSTGAYVPQPFEVETDALGNELIYSNQANAVLRYTQSISDTTKFTPIFTEALIMLVAAKLAGPVIKGSEGRAAATELMKTFFTWWKEKAVESDANQRRIKLIHTSPWMGGR